MRVAGKVVAGADVLGQPPLTRRLSLLFGNAQNLIGCDIIENAIPSRGPAYDHLVDHCSASNAKMNSRIILRKAMDPSIRLAKRYRLRY
jgi:hypothetical protein